MIVELAGRFEWAYAPSLYEVGYHDDGTVSSFEPTVEGIGRQMVRCQTHDFEAAPFPVRPLVPHVEVVHDRISIEIMRGCPQRCRFCHAGYTKRPLRVRSVEENDLHRAGVSLRGLENMNTPEQYEEAKLQFG